MALISMSQGTASKKPFMMKIENGSSRVTITRITPDSVSSRPLQYMIRKIGITSVMAGNACSTSRPWRKPARPAKAKRER